MGWEQQAQAHAADREASGRLLVSDPPSWFVVLDKWFTSLSLVALAAY